MPTLKIIRLLFFAAITLVISQSSYGALNLNLDLGTIKGDSTLSLHPNTIECDSFSLNTTNSGAGIIFGDLVITKKLDKSSPLLFLNSAQSTSIPSAILYGSKPVGTSGNIADCYVIKLTNARISSVSQSYSTSGDLPTESLTFRYDKIEIDYTAYNTQGQAQTPVVFKWDLTTNSTF